MNFSEEESDHPDFIFGPHNEVIPWDQLTEEEQRQALVLWQSYYSSHSPNGDKPGYGKNDRRSCRGGNSHS